MTTRPAPAAALAALALAAVAIAKPPAVFTDADFETAKARAAEDGKLLVVDATAVWCAPCKQMDRTTWVDESVVAWFDEHGIALQFDVDRQKKLARTLRISAMPTVIVFKDGAEFDRVVGYRDAKTLLSWLEGARAGRREIDRLREKAGDRGGADGKVDVKARMDLARSLVEARDLEAATDEYVWLWENMLTHRRSLFGVRYSFFIGEVTRLINRYPPARKAFTGFRDRAQPALDDGTADLQTAMDWVHLNKALGESKVTLAWYEKRRDDPAVERVAKLVANAIFDELVAMGRFADAGRALSDPYGRVTKDLETLERMSEVPDDDRGITDPETMKRLTAMLRDQAVTVYVACLAAKRDDEARRIARAVLETMDDAVTRRALVGRAITVGEPRPQHEAWLDEADAMLAEKDTESAERERAQIALLKKQLRNALAKAASAKAEDPPS